MLVPRRPHDLGLDVVDARAERRQQPLLGAERGDLRGVPAVTPDEAGRDLGRQAVIRLQAGRDPIELGRVGGADELQVGRAGRSRPGVLPEHAERGIDRVPSHDPVRRELAAGDPDEAIRLGQ